MNKLELLLWLLGAILTTGIFAVAIYVIKNAPNKSLERHSASTEGVENETDYTIRTLKAVPWLVLVGLVLRFCTKSKDSVPFSSLDEKRSTIQNQREPTR